MKTAIYKYEGTMGTLSRYEQFDFPDNDPPTEMFFHQESVFINNKDLSKATINVSRVVVVQNLELVETKDGRDI